MKKTKSPNHSTYQSALTISRANYNDIKQRLAWRTYNPSEKFVDALAQDLYDWAQLEESLDFLDFYHKVGIPRSTCQDWVKRYHNLKAVHEEVKEIIGARRQRLAIFKKYETNPNVLMMTLRKYHPDWQEAFEEEAALKREQGENALLELLKNTSIAVPELKRESNDDEEDHASE